LYSKTYQHQFIIGNFIIAFLTSLAVFNIFLVDSYNILSLKFLYTQFPFVVFAFLFTFTREIIKDLEDLEGDALMNSKNLASVLSLDKTKYFILSLLLISLTIYILWTIIWRDEIILVLYNILIMFLICISGYKLFISQKKSDFSKISGLIKIIMFFGILFIPLFYLVT